MHQHHHPIRQVAAAAIWALAAGVALAGGPVSQSGPTVQPGPDNTDRLIVKYRDASRTLTLHGQPLLQSRALPAADLAARVVRAQAAAQRLGSMVWPSRQTAVGAHVFTLDRALSLTAAQQLADSLKAADPRIEYALPDRRVKPLLLPNDPSFTSQWDLYDASAGIRAPQAWDLATGQGVVVAVLDTGLLPHADLAGQTVAGFDMVSDVFTANDGQGRDTDPSDPGDWVAANECGIGEPASASGWHGTHVAGTIAARTGNGQGIAGIAHQAKLQPVRVLGKCGGFMSDVADGIVWASGGAVSGVPVNRTPARVINLSLGAAGPCDPFMQSVVGTATARGALVVAAAGNAGNSLPVSPASCAGVLAVAATDRQGQRAYYSSHGPHVGLAAPGGDMRANPASGILSLLNDGSTVPGRDILAHYQGTSMAAPHVAGVAALMFSVRPKATPAEVAAALKASARAFPGSCEQCGSGLLDAEAAVRALTQAAGAAPTLALQRVPPVMVAGQAYSVRWVTTDATAVTYDCKSAGTGYMGQGSLSANGSATGTALVAWVGQPSTCTWTARGPGGSKTMVETLTTQAPLVPRPTLGIRRVPAVMVAGEPYTVSWTTTGATAVTYQCSATGGGYAGSGSLSPNASTSGTASPEWVGHPSACTWTAIGPGGSTSQAETLSTQAAAVPPPTLSIQRVPATLRAGQAYTLYWSSSHATTVSYHCSASGSGYSGSGLLPQVHGSTAGMGEAAWVGFPSQCTYTAAGPGGQVIQTETLVTQP